MNILLVNPPDCGRSIPEERYGITSLKQIFRGEPLALEELAGNLVNHNVTIIDLKADPDGLETELPGLRPEVVGITGVTCEANTMLRIAARIKEVCGATVVVGGSHASCDPAFFNLPVVDFIVVGIGKRIFSRLVAALENGTEQATVLPGVLRTRPGRKITLPPICSGIGDLVMDRPPAYHLVSRYRSHYILEKLDINMGFVASAFGCPHRCSFCCIKGQTGGSYLTKSIDAVIRDIQLLAGIPVIRLVDANTFGNPQRALQLCRAIGKAGIKKQYLADIRSDTVVRYPDMLQEWKEIGLRAVIVGFEEVSDIGLAAMNKANKVAMNTEAIRVLHQIGITIVGDFILSPDYSEADFDRLNRYLTENHIDLPMVTVMTPLPGTPLYLAQQYRIVNHDLDYYTLTNAVVPTRLEEKKFYTLYSEIIRKSHQDARL
jgi:radical SAM superfamily enzyme YgiQ (UPF0313 family)